MCKLIHHVVLLNIKPDVFAFDMYDTDNDGVLSNEQVHTMFNELLGVHHAHTAQNEL